MTPDAVIPNDVDGCKTSAPIISGRKKGRPKSEQKRNLLKAVKERDGPLCAVCSQFEIIKSTPAIVGGPRNNPALWVWGHMRQSNMDLDHITPLWKAPHLTEEERQGLNKSANLQILCKTCHRKKCGIENAERRRWRGGKP